MNTPIVQLTNTEPASGCYCQSPGVGLYDIHNFTATSHTQFWCANTATGSTYFGPIDSYVTAAGQCITSACPSTTGFCEPIDKSSATYAQTSGDYNRYYHVLVSMEIRADLNSCQQPASGWNQDFRQCTGQWAGQCGTAGGGWNDGCGSPDGTPPPDDGFGSGPGLNSPPLDCGIDPLIIDVEGEGFHMTSTAGGVKLTSGRMIPWTDPRFHNGFLVLDINGDGKITGWRELFGNFSLQPASAHPNGFAALALYDLPMNGGNGDGIIDSKDSIYSALRIWIDANHDGISQPNELHTLAELGVESLDLGYKESRRVDEFGNVFRYKARVNKKAAGGKGEASEVGHWAYDVFFTTK